jgi:hypothetical protein
MRAFAHSVSSASDNDCVFRVATASSAEAALEESSLPERGEAAAATSPAAKGNRKEITGA